MMGSGEVRVEIPRRDPVWISILYDGNRVCPPCRQLSLHVYNRQHEYRLISWNHPASCQSFFNLFYMVYTRHVDDLPKPDGSPSNGHLTSLHHLLLFLLLPCFLFSHSLFNFIFLHLPWADPRSPIRSAHYAGFPPMVSFPP